MYSQGHTPASFDSIPLADRAALLRWYCNGFIGPFGDAQRAYMAVLSGGFVKQAPAFDKLFPFHYHLWEGDESADETAIANAKAIEGLINMQAELEAQERAGSKPGK